MLFLLVVIPSLSLFFTPTICIAENLRIGYIGALTGDAAAIGTEIAKVLEVAIEEGATLVRIGTALFGTRA